MAGTLAAAAVGAQTGVALTTDASRLAIVLPLAALGALLLGVLSLTHFTVFILAALVARSSLDAVRLAPDGGLAALLNPASALALLFLGSAAAWTWRRRRDGLRHPNSPLQVAAALYLVAAAISVVGSDDVMISGLELTRIAAAVCMFFVLDRMLSDEASVRRLLVALFASAVVPVSFALVGLASSPAAFLNDADSRFAATFAHPNSFAHYLVVLVLMGVAVVPHVHGRWRLALGVLVAVMALGLLMTFTRGAWIGLFVGLVVIGLLQSRSILLALVVVTIALPLAVPSVAERVAEVQSDEASPVQREDSFEWRLKYWGRVVDLADETPVTGIGLKMTGASTVEGKQPHNDYLRAYVEMGLVGLLAFIGLVAALITTAWRGVRRNGPGLARGVSVGFLAYACAFALVSVAENLNSQVVVLWYLFAAAATANWAARRPVLHVPSPRDSSGDARVRS